MPVDRSYIQPLATDPDPGQRNLYQALTALANFGDTLEKAAGVSATGGSGAAQAAAPAQATAAITAAQGHYVVQMTNPQNAAAAIQHQLQSAISQNFDANSATNTFTLGLGALSLDMVDPNENRYWRWRSRYQGSAWNPWRAYATAAGIVALNAGVLRTS